MSSKIVEKITPEITAWQNRPPDSVYQFVFMDAIHYRVKENHQYIIKAAYVVWGIQMDGRKDILIIKRKNLSVLGIHKNKLAVSLVINVITGISLLAMFISKNTKNIVFNINSFYAISYILVAGIFEMIFIYGFLRYEFERAFGILRSILITAVFYSLHYAGFQPEFTKLFFVGIMYVTVFYFTYNIFSIFPLFWGVGAIWDVLVNSEAGNQIKNKTSFITAILIFIFMIGISFFIYCKSKEKK